MQKITWVPATNSTPGEWQIGLGQKHHTSPNFRAHYNGHPVIVFHPPGATAPLVCDEAQLDIIDFGDQPIVVHLEVGVVHSYVTFRELKEEGGTKNPFGFTPATKTALTEHLNKLSRFGLNYITPEKVTVLKANPAAGRRYFVWVEGFGSVGVLDKPVFDTVKVFDVWVEGYQATGDRAPARLLGRAVSGTWEDACLTLLEGNDNYSAEYNTYWGCRLFDNEADARKAFG